MGCACTVNLHKTIIKQMETLSMLLRFENVVYRILEGNLKPGSGGGGAGNENIIEKYLLFLVFK